MWISKAIGDISTGKGQSKSKGYLAINISRPSGVEEGKTANAEYAHGAASNFGEENGTNLEM